MTNRQFFMMKFDSGRLKEFNYKIDNLSFNAAREFGEIIALADNQILRSIRHVNGREVDLEQVEKWYVERDKKMNQKSSEGYIVEIEKLKQQIHESMFMPEIIAIVIKHNTHYKYLFENGLILNGKKYFRLSCSAGQSRVSTVIFCEEDTAAKVKVVLNNGRNEDMALTPSKFNAYFGVAGSATKIISSPRFCVVPDYKSPSTMKVNFVTENEDWEEDDIIEVVEIAPQFNRFDGQGLIRYSKAKEWAKELGLDYVPAQWRVSQNFIKGMLCTVPEFEEFFSEDNDINYLIKTSYRDENGNPKYADLRQVDAVITESQFKLWNSFMSKDVYEKNCNRNKLHWGVSSFSPKQDNDILKMNYQFLQTLYWSHDNIEEACKQFVDWISGVNAENIYYTLLFLVGRNPTEEKIKEYLQSNENHWVKSLIVNHGLIHDEYVKKKIYDLIKKRIQNGCMGEIIVDGNFQTIVSDPYAMMQHVCSMKVTGLLGKNEYYSHYWNEKGINVVDSMRAPLTYRSEHLKLNLVNSDDMSNVDRGWYRYCNSGIIVNVHGYETVNWAGSDYDMDILATTSSATVLQGVYENELPITYDPPKPEISKITEDDLYNADIHAFGSIIGSITNKSTSAYAMLPMFDPNSKEYQTLMNRLKMCTKLQSAQIDKAKLGRKVKGIPQNWIKYNRIKEDDSPELKEQKEFYNRILLDRHPYFFIYLYRDTKTKYKKYVSSNDISCQQKFGIPLKQLLNQSETSNEERKFIDSYKKNLPVIDSDCVMNNLCKYIESIDFKIKKKINAKTDKEIYKLYLANDVEETRETYNAIRGELMNFNRDIKEMGNNGLIKRSRKNKFDDNLESDSDNRTDKFKTMMESKCSNIKELTNYLVKLFYVDKVGANKDWLWNAYGSIMFKNVKCNTGIQKILFPLPDKDGDIDYLNNKYKNTEVQV